MAAVHITTFTKSSGPLSKKICLAQDGTVKSDGSACVMSRGVGRRERFGDIGDFAGHIGRLASNQAIALGILRPGLPNEVEIAAKRRINSAAPSHIIARTRSNIVFAKERPALALIDFDSKSMPHAVADRLTKHGGVWQALLSVLPALRNVAHVIRRSTSAGLYRTDTGQRLPGSNNQHLYMLVRDGSDIDRFLRTLHARCWLAGFGWMMVGAGGQLLERSIVDRMVGAPERLVFEAPPVLEPPLAQDQDSRRPAVYDGAALDTVGACPPLTIPEQANLRELQAREAHRLAPESAKARSAFIAEQTTRLAERTGMSTAAAAAVLARQCEGVLHPDVELPFDDRDLQGATVADVLANPERFEGETLADPLEGVDYGRCKARIMQRPDGTPWINSFAHGRTTYELRLDARAVRKAMESADNAEIIKTFVRLALIADLDDDEIEELRNLAAERTGISKRTITRTLNTAERQRALRHTKEEYNRRLAERRDPRPLINTPTLDAPWLPQMRVINDVLQADKSPVPTLRNIDGVVVRCRRQRVPGTHAFTPETSNPADLQNQENEFSPPEQWLLVPLNEMELAEVIEDHIDYVDRHGRSVHLPTTFVRHYLKRDDGVLPMAVAVSTLPIVLADGATLGMHEGFDRLRGIVLHIPKEVMATIPRRQDCTPIAVKEAMKFLCDEWLCDVATDHVGKCTLIAAALTLIERSLLPDRPVFFVTAGRRGGGKTTTLSMLVVAITGLRPAAAAWSSNEEERRKALMSYFLYGVSYIVWDNIPRGTQISCPHIEKSCTAAYYSDRRLGVSEIVATAAATIHLFTGNNIGPRGDLASRSLQVRLEVERPDPENREFKHTDPVAWTEANRAEILQALYTILLGNPMLAADPNAASRTRFKMWWRIVGAAVEHAASQIGHHLDFRSLFLAQEEEDEESASLATVLEVMANYWKSPFKAADVAELVNDRSSESGTTLREFLFPGAPTTHIATAKTVAKRLKAHIGEPVRSGEHTFTLREWRNPVGGPKAAFSYYVRVD